MMSIQMPEHRRYELKERARKQAATRLRIVEALVELHETVGASRAGVGEVAKRAGVNRMTVYNHFATEADMVAACTSHWIERHPPPDIDAWRAVRDPDERLSLALEELYAYYRETQAMWGTAYRDAPLVPALGAIMDETWFALLDSAVDVLAAGRGARGRSRERLRAALRTAIDFPTWRSLVRAGLADREAAGVAAGLVSAALAGPPARRAAAAMA
jgi:AcrR family transcriptional regulator